jgi:bifunctional non-homologous end joining protein LigD
MDRPPADGLHVDGLGGSDALHVPLLPMLAVVGALPEDPSAWSYEMKWDGVRVIARVAEGRVRLTSRSGSDVTVAYPELAELSARLDGPAILDGEVVALDDDARPSFQLLQRRVHVSGAGRARRLAATVPIAFLVFDACMLAGRWLLEEPYLKRRSELEACALASDHLAVPAAIEMSGAPALELARSCGLEGVVVKRLDSPYRPGSRSASWVKHKLVDTVEVVVCGYMPGTGWRAGSFGALVLGVQGEDGLGYAGRVGTGFTEHAIRELKASLVPLQCAGHPFARPPDEALPGVVWVRPLLVAEVAFQRWTALGRLRAPSWRGLRPDLSPDELQPPPGRAADADGAHPLRKKAVG